VTIFVQPPGILLIVSVFTVHYYFSGNLLARDGAAQGLQSFIQLQSAVCSTKPTWRPMGCRVGCRVGCPAGSERSSRSLRGRSSSADRRRGFRFYRQHPSQLFFARSDGTPATTSKHIDILMFFSLRLASFRYGTRSALRSKEA